VLAATQARYTDINTCMVEKHDINAGAEVVKRLSDSEDLVDILIDIEDYFDRNNLYVFKNWMDGEVVGGPFVKRYWVKLILKYPYKKMPDPDGGLRLLKHGTRIRYDIGVEEYPMEVKSESDFQPGTKKPKMAKRKVWLITMLIPRRFVQNLDSEIMDQYDEEVDVDVADDAKAEGNTVDQAVGAAT
jgi:hypothetical protein